MIFGGLLNKAENIASKTDSKEIMSFFSDKIFINKGVYFKRYFPLNDIDLSTLKIGFVWHGNYSVKALEFTTKNKREKVEVELMGFRGNDFRNLENVIDEYKRIYLLKA
jgi:hypothetical protein